jgi:hypothetical protein
VTIGVMFLRCAKKLASPDAWVCALAAVAIIPRTIIAAVKVSVNFLMTFSFADAGKMHRDSSVVPLSQPHFKPAGSRPPSLRRSRPACS